jgi:ankyrin repeat protein
MLAAQMDAVEIATALLKKGAKIDFPMKNGDTALHIAARNNKTSMAYFLITQGADTEILNSDGNTPLMVAANNNSEASANILMQAGADLSVKNRMGQNASEIAALKGFKKFADIMATEDIKRGMMASKLSEMRQQQDLTHAPAPVPTSEVSKNKAPDPKKKTTKKRAVPKPYFTDEQKAKM